MRSNFTRISFFLYFLFSTGLTWAQPIEFAVLTFNRVGNLIYLEAIADQKTGYFLIDTGYRGILLNKRFFEGRLTNMYLQGTNGLGNQLADKSVDLKLGLIQLNDMDAQVTDLSKLEKSIGIPLHGIIGSTFFEDFELMIDYAHNRMILIQLNDQGEKTVELPLIMPATDTLSFRLKGHLPVIAVNIGSRELQLGIDTGASSNLFRDDNWSKLGGFVWGKKEVFLRGLGKARKKTKAGMVSQVEMEGIPFQAMHTLFSNIGNINRDLRGPKLDGIIGYEFLHQYTMALNFRKKELYLWRQPPVEESSRINYIADNDK